MWLIDDTFRSAPHNFTQVSYTNGFIYDRLFPLIFIFLGKKSVYLKKLQKCIIYLIIALF